MSRPFSISGEVKFNAVIPQRSQVFLLLSSELGKLQRVPGSKLKWDELDELCQRIFTRYGYDLHTGVWFCLIQLRLASWQGLAKALELLAASLSFAERKLNDDSQRRYALAWFIENVITPVYVQAQSDADSGSLNRIEMALKVLVQQAQALQLRGSDMLSNLSYYLQVRGRAGHHIVLDVDDTPQMQLICKDADVVTVVAASSEHKEQVEPEGEVEVTLIEDLPDRRWRWVAFGALLVSALLLVPMGGYLMFKYLSSPHPVVKIFSDIERIEQQVSSAALFREPLSNKEIQQVEEQLQKLSAKTPGWLLQQGNFIADGLAKTQPDNMASLAWGKILKANSRDLSRAQGWFDVQQRLNQLEQRLLESEKKQRNHITISELKTEVYEMKQALKNMDVPVSVLLWQYQKSLSNNEVSAGEALMDIRNEITRDLSNFISIK